MLQSERVKKDIRKQVKSSAGNYNLNTQGIRTLRIPLPGKNEQQGLLERLAAIRAVVEAATRHTETIRKMRSAVLNILFSGEML
jgi:type I restriction enzyme S subunit